MPVSNNASKNKSLLFTLLLLPGLVTDGWPDGNLFAVPLDAPLIADKDAEAALLEDADVVVVGVPHGPPRGVFLGLLAFRRIDEPVVIIRIIIHIFQNF